MKSKWKKILRLLVWTIFISSIFIITGFINHSFREEKCEEVLIEIQDVELYGFIDEGDITYILNNQFNTPISQKIRDINTFEIERTLNDHQAIEKAEVFISIDRKLHIKINQRKPVVRVYSKTGDFYIDDLGKVMPTWLKYTAHVPIISGEIDLDYFTLINETNKDIEDIDSSMIPPLYLDLVKVSDFIHENPFWRAQIEQLYVDKHSEFEMIPRVGNHTIVIGEVYNLESKFNKLKLFYEEGLSKTGWNEYKTINLKYKDQVVCTKRYKHG